MRKALRRQFARLVKEGRLDVALPDGEAWRFGDGTGPPAAIAIRDDRSIRRLLTDPDLALGECYMDGSVAVTRGSVYDFLAILFANMRHADRLPLAVTLPYALRIAAKRLHQRNVIGRARDHVAHHYDLSGQLYELFLDCDRQYSCAYFEHAQATLEEAQRAKMRHIAAKLAISPGMRVLDIGCGWGGLSLYLAQACGAHVTGVTLSVEQHACAAAAAEARGVGHVEFHRMDYRQVDGSFDRIVSVGMFEHVGVAHFSEYFAAVRQLLAPDGVALIHSICRLNGPGATSAWTRKYIFPGGYIPALSEVVPPIEGQGLIVSDIEILRLHYAETIRHWRARFAASRDRARQLYDERFCRMWEFYLAASECAFRFGGMGNMQIQLVRDLNALPLTRDYMRRDEDALKALDSRPRHLRSVQRR
jgi:cyclopropane-fatty-acyl-phospholipid synthase